MVHFKLFILDQAKCSLSTRLCDCKRCISIAVRFYVVIYWNNILYFAGKALYVLIGVATIQVKRNTKYKIFLVFVWLVFL